jgi:prepilin-type N-terminal cleavage/methylation domain-containing protein/prepilin-type processing-associated H-X9-DG protein
MEFRGFTLLELVVVIAILGVLVSLLFPAIAGALGSADTVQCQSNLRQWTLALRSYAQQNNGALPRRGQGVQPTAEIDRPEDWFNAMPKALGLPGYKELADSGRIPRPGDVGLWMCPSAQGSGGPSKVYFAYAMNMRLSTWLTGVPDYLETIRDPSTQVFMADGPGAFCSTLPSTKAYSPVARHGGMVNISFLDGHVASFPGDYVGCGKGDPHHPDVRWVVPGSPWPGPKD